MFQREMKSESWEKLEITTNELNEEITSFSFVGRIDVAIFLDTKRFYQNNDMDITNIDVIGVTRDRSVKRGDRIAGKYIVQFVEKSRLFDTLYMKEIDNDGEF